MVLLASTTALAMLFAWALRNPNTLLKQTTSQDKTQVATNAAPLSENPKPATGPEAGKLAVVNTSADQLQASDKTVNGDGEQEQEVVQQQATNQETEKNDQSKIEAAKLATNTASIERPVTIEPDARQLAAQRLAAAETDQLSTESTFAQRLAKEKASIDKALVDSASAGQELSGQGSADEKATTEKPIEEKIAAEIKLAVDALTTEAAANENSSSADNLETEQLVALPSAKNETAFEVSRREDLAELSELATQIQFETHDTETTDNSKQLLDRMFELLFLYSETTVTVQVTTNEYEVDNTNQLLSRLRSLVIINYLVRRGLSEGRFKIQALGQQEIPSDSHQVSVVATVIDNGDNK